MRFVNVCAALLFITTEASAGEQAGPREVRRHYSFGSSPATYRVTAIARSPNNTEDRNLFLVEDVNGDRLTIEHRRDYLEQTSVHEIVDLQTKEFVRATVRLPFKSATREETIKEYRANPSLFEGTDAPVMIELNGVSAQAKETDWLGAKMREQRSTLRRAATAQFLERLERLRAVGGSDHLQIFCTELLRYVLYNEACSSSLQVVQVHGDCAFDASFRYACSDQQKARLKKAIESGKSPGFY